MGQSIKEISTPIRVSIHNHEWNTVLDISHIIPDVLCIIHWIRDDAQQFLRCVQLSMYTRVDYIEFPQMHLLHQFAKFCICDIFDVGCVYTRDYLRAYRPLLANGRILWCVCLYQPLQVPWKRFFSFPKNTDQGNR